MSVLRLNKSGERQNRTYTAVRLPNASSIVKGPTIQRHACPKISKGQRIDEMRHTQRNLVSSSTGTLEVFYGLICTDVGASTSIEIRPRGLLAHVISRYSRLTDCRRKSTRTRHSRKPSSSSRSGRSSLIPIENISSSW